MKKFIVSALALMMAVTAVPAMAQSSSRSEWREHRQQERIWRGAVRGDLTPREWRRLERQQRRIDRAQWRAGRDGYLSPREARRLERMQDRADRNIWRKNNNFRDGRDWRGYPGSRSYRDYRW